MKDKKKMILIISLVVSLLIITAGVTYSAFVYRENTNNQQLVLGDIYMYYEETNELSIDNMVPKEEIKQITYLIPNPVMQTEEPGTGILAKCEIFFEKFLNDMSTNFDEGTTATTFCQGTGTVGNTNITGISSGLSSEYKQQLGNDGVLIEMTTYYTIMLLNPIMQTEESGTGVLGRCESIFLSLAPNLIEGESVTSFCQGTGTLQGITFYQFMDSLDKPTKQYLTNIFLPNDITIPIIERPYFEFTISGKNEYTKEDIYYEVLLMDGDVPEGKQEINRIKDSSLRFMLAEVNEDNSENVLLVNLKYDDITNRRIWAETIKKNTTEEIDKKYRLYMWIDEDVTICGGEITTGCDYYTSGDTNNWNDVFASVKVSVKGDFNKKEMSYAEKYNVTDESCFETEVVPIYNLNQNMTSEELNKCVTIFTDHEWLWWFDDTNEAELFCLGDGKRGNLTFQNYLSKSYGFDSDRLTYLEENNIIISAGNAVLITNYDKKCGENVVIPDIINNHDKIKIRSGAFRNLQLQSVIFSNSVITIDDSSFVGNYFSSVTIPESVAFWSCRAFDEHVYINNSSDLVCVLEFS